MEVEGLNTVFIIRISIYCRIRHLREFPMEVLGIQNQPEEKVAVAHRKYVKKSGALFYPVVQSYRFDSIEPPAPADEVGEYAARSTVEDQLHRDRFVDFLDHIYKRYFRNIYEYIYFTPGRLACQFMQNRSK